MTDKKRAKSPPPPDDAPHLRRTCTRCGAVRNWTEAFCACGNPEFSVPKESISNEA